MEGNIKSLLKLFFLEKSTIAVKTQLKNNKSSIILYSYTTSELERQISLLVYNLLKWTKKRGGKLNSCVSTCISSIRSSINLVSRDYNWGSLIGWSDGVRNNGIGSSRHRWMGWECCCCWCVRVCVRVNVFGEQTRSGRIRRSWASRCEWWRSFRARPPFLFYYSSSFFYFFPTC